MTTVRPANSPAATRTSAGPLDPSLHALGNELTLRVGGSQPPVPAGGFLQQLKQATALANLTASAEQSIDSAHRTPTDFAVASKLASLGLTPLLGDAGKHSTADYVSRIPGASPGAVYEWLLGHPNEAFSGAGLSARPATAKLQSGGRVMLEDARSTPGLWFPVEVRPEPSRRRLSFLTLDGHPLRGQNDFQFDADGRGGTQVRQSSRFQSSSAVTALGARLTGAVDHQHEVWRNFHAGLFRHFIP